MRVSVRVQTTQVRTLTVGPPGASNEVLVVGDGTPVILVAHAWGASARVMLPTVLRLPGTKAVVNFRGYGGSAPRPDGWTYADLADELAGVAEAVGATTGVGQSMGAGALLALADRQPDLFTTLALLLPPALDEPIPPDVLEMFRRIHGARLVGDPDELRAEIAACMTPELRGARGGDLYLRAYALMLLACTAPTERPGNAPVASRSGLARVGARTLVVGQEGDLIHRTATVAEVATALPRARTHVFPAAVPMWSDRRTLRGLLTDHLAD
ncbi:putative hydrolase or acyltransferase of alpha/beta superfamily [Frankia sp. EI5c]|uniref:alpha/beta fold hydrolase n=1 Tax=Frankia sp. EI5c TaxID=683316 RepID=UPI0007C2D642|nr:alpha/beta hydrolase [Frankia sp. EI5c]OAA25868.1 putative hydrolase or acyltransferase of alpha/beta superfamily [Frankia sp. EI5c]